MAFYRDNKGVIQHVTVDGGVHKAAFDAKLTVPQYLNKKYPDADTKLGSAFQQLCASEGLAIPEANAFGIRAPIMADVLAGQFEAAGPTNNSTVLGQSARSLFPIAILDIVEQTLSRDRETDAVLFDRMIAQEISVVGDSFIQPVVDYSGTGGPEKAKPQRAAEFAEPGNILRIGTAEVVRSLPTFTIGIEFSDKAQRNLGIDVIATTIARYVQVEREQRVYNYLSALFNGDNDLVSGAVPAVTSTSLDANATAGVMTHKAWVKFLATARKYRRLTTLIMDIDTYLKVEGRTGRPGSNNYDPTLARIDPQAQPMDRANNVGFGNDVEFMIVDSAAEGGPVPANTIWAVDKTKAITRVKSTTADYNASEAFALRRSTAMRWDYGEAVYRQFGDTDLKPFAVLTIL
jgi:hypothetical protein